MGSNELRIRANECRTGGMMDPKIKAAWLKALRSGKYKQARKKLATNNGRFCCLGVLYIEAVGGWWERNKDGNWSTRKSSYSGLLPASVREPLGLSDGAMRKLAHMNDNGKTFAEIADWIEVNL